MSDRSTAAPRTVEDTIRRAVWLIGHEIKPELASPHEVEWESLQRDLSQLLEGPSSAAELSDVQLSVIAIEALDVALDAQDRCRQSMGSEDATSPMPRWIDVDEAAGFICGRYGLELQSSTEILGKRMQALISDHTYLRLYGQLPPNRYPRGLSWTDVEYEQAPEIGVKA